MVKSAKQKPLLIQARDLVQKADGLLSQIEMEIPHYDPVGKLGEIVNVERKRQGLTIRELADLAGLSTQTIINLEAGKEASKLSNVIKVLEILGKKLWIQ